ncbi:MAG: hypothetical protein AB2813_11445 [Candidatus Sedimenticola endophacoides]
MLKILQDEKTLLVGGEFGADCALLLLQAEDGVVALLDLLPGGLDVALQLGRYRAALALQGRGVPLHLRQLDLGAADVAARDLDHHVHCGELAFEGVADILLGAKGAQQHLVPGSLLGPQPLLLLEDLLRVPDLFGVLYLHPALVELGAGAPRLLRRHLVGVVDGALVVYPAV